MGKDSEGGMSRVFEGCWGWDTGLTEMEIFKTLLETKKSPCQPSRQGFTTLNGDLRSRIWQQRLEWSEVGESRMERSIEGHDCVAESERQDGWVRHNLA